LRNFATHDLLLSGVCAHYHLRGRRDLPDLRRPRYRLRDARDAGHARNRRGRVHSAR
jgi:hypothetical protein